jgi:hypothetical protein
MIDVNAASSCTDHYHLSYLGMTRAADPQTRSRPRGETGITTYHGHANHRGRIPKASGGFRFETSPRVGLRGLWLASAIVKKIICQVEKATTRATGHL